MFVMPFPSTLVPQARACYGVQILQVWLLVPQFPSLTKGRRREYVQYSVCCSLPAFHPSPPALSPSGLTFVDLC